MRRSLLCLLLCCSGVLARDPFHPVTQSRCLAPVKPLTGWRLQGIIGRETRFHALLITPQGQAIVVRSGHAFAMTPWQLSDIGRHSLTLSVTNSCSAQRTSFHLKGSPYEKDPDAAGFKLPDATPGR